MYSIIELQTNNGVTAHLYYTAETKNLAMQKFHEILSFAAVSNINYHTALVVDEQGKYIARECYEHATSIIE